MRRLLVFLIILLNCYIVFFLANQVFAAFSFQISQVSSDTISSRDEEIIVGLSITDLPSESYFRVVFQKSDGANYFGYMKNDLNEWVKSDEDCKKFFHVTDKTTAHLEIPLKVGEDGIESGIYNIKSHRYTASCSSNTVATNSAQIQLIFPTLTPPPTTTPTQTLSPTPGVGSEPSVSPTSPAVVLTGAGTISPISYQNIFISEAMVNPESGKNEWVEIYNDNDFLIFLVNWFIDDLENAGSSSKIFSLEIPSKSYRVFNLTSSIFNNGGDSVRLLDFNKNLKDDFEYRSSTQGKTYGRISLASDEFCLQEPSYEAANNPCLILSSTDRSVTPSPITTLISKISPTTSSSLKSSARSLQSNAYLPAEASLGLRSHFGEGGAKVGQIYSGSEQVLGVSTLNPKQNLLPKILSFVSLSYSLLVIVSVLIKNKVFQKYVLASFHP